MSGLKIPEWSEYNLEMYDFGSQEPHTTSPALGKPLIGSFSNSEIHLRIDLIGECTSPIEEVWRRYSQGGGYIYKVV